MKTVKRIAKKDYVAPEIFSMSIKELVKKDGSPIRIWHSANTKNHGQSTC